jgi:putative membrane protein
MMNGGHMGNFSQGRYGGLQQDFHSLNTLFGNNLKEVIFVGLIVLVIYVFFKRQKNQGSEQTRETSAVTTAKEAAKLRYACGEISHEEFQSILKAIEV